MSVGNVAAEMKVSRQAIYDLKKAAGPASRCSTEEEEGVWWPMENLKENRHHFQTSSDIKPIHYRRLAEEKAREPPQGRVNTHHSALPSEGPGTCHKACCQEASLDQSHEKEMRKFFQEISVQGTQRLAESDVFRLKYFPPGQEKLEVGKAALNLVPLASTSTRRPQPSTSTRLQPRW